MLDNLDLELQLLIFYSIVIPLLLLYARYAANGKLWKGPPESEELNKQS
jgi:hypothetical protein